MDTYMDSWHSYPSIFALGHKALEYLFANNVLIEEKIDGSQFSFGKIAGVLRVKSKGQEFPIDAPPDMFVKAVETVQQIGHLLTPDWTYRAEYLSKPQHNSLAYDRIPNQHLIIFDINTGLEHYLAYEDKRLEAERLGLETVPMFHYGKVDNFDEFMEFLERGSILGGQKVEGVVIKNYFQFAPDKKVLMGKYVSERFKEIHRVEWGKSNPTSGDFIDLITLKYKTSARWHKAVQHLEERGVLEHQPRDIGKLMLEVPIDVLKECEEQIKEDLFKHAWPKIKRGIIAGIPEWYKAELAKSQKFGENE